MKLDILKVIRSPASPPSLSTMMPSQRNCKKCGQFLHPVSPLLAVICRGGGSFTAQWYCITEENGWCSPIVRWSFLHPWERVLEARKELDGHAGLLLSWAVMPLPWELVLLQAVHSCRWSCLESFIVKMSPTPLCIFASLIQALHLSTHLRCFLQEETSKLTMTFTLGKY